MQDLIVTDLEKHFRNYKDNRPNAPIREAETVSQAKTSDNYELPDIATVRNFGSYNRKMEKSGGGVIFSQPQFFSPVYTPINWQIPSKRQEIYMWLRFWYENEPSVAAGIDFYSKYPITGFELECKDRHIKRYYDNLNKKLNLDKWLRIISHEVHLMGDCFPFLEVDCPHCKGSGRHGGEICEHEGGTFKRIVILNPDFVEVFTNPISPTTVITLLPDDELRDLVRKKGPGFEKLSPQIIEMVRQGRPIPLDNLSVSHLRFGETGYRRYGISLLKRLFPILSYKTKIMTAQWIVAERMIVPIKVVKVGTEERPASPADIANVQNQLATTANDPSLCLVTHHAFELEWYGATGKIHQMTGEYEFIRQEVFDG